MTTRRERIAAIAVWFLVAASLVLAAWIGAAHGQDGGMPSIADPAAAPGNGSIEVLITDLARAVVAKDARFTAAAVLALVLALVRLLVLNGGWRRGMKWSGERQKRVFAWAVGLGGVGSLTGAGILAGHDVETSLVKAAGIVGIALLLWDTAGKGVEGIVRRILGNGARGGGTAAALVALVTAGLLAGGCARGLAYRLIAAERLEAECGRRGHILSCLDDLDGPRPMAGGGEVYELTRRCECVPPGGGTAPSPRP